MVVSPGEESGDRQSVPPTSRNIDELKRLVITALDRNGVLSELRTRVKLHVTRAINEENQSVGGGSPLVHPRGNKLGALMATERGQLLTELVVDFLRYYELNDTLSMFLVEANLPRLRPSESEVASQCGFRFSPTAGLSVLEQYLVQQPGLHLPPQHANVASRFDTQVPEEGAPSIMHQKLMSEKIVPEEDEFAVQEGGLSDRATLNTSLEQDMNQMRRISNEINRISDSKRYDDFSGSDVSDSPRYEDDFEGPIVGDVLEGVDFSPLQVRSQGFSNPIDDNVLFESKDSFKNLGESPAKEHPLDLNDHIESLDRSPH